MAYQSSDHVIIYLSHPLVYTKDFGFVVKFQKTTLLFCRL